jgi:cytoskeletal protein CcmA (bactofilin family)
MSGGKSLLAKSGLRAPSASEEISAYLGKETVFEGKMTFEGVFRLDGRLDGEIFESGILIIGETAVVKGKVGVNVLIVNGIVEGEIAVKERTEIHATGKLYGTLTTPVLVIAEGGMLEGNCQMKGPRAGGEEPQPAPAPGDSLSPLE